MFYLAEEGSLKSPETLWPFRVAFDVFFSLVLLQAVGQLLLSDTLASVCSCCLSLPADAAVSAKLGVFGCGSSFSACLTEWEPTCSRNQKRSVIYSWGDASSLNTICVFVPHHSLRLCEEQHQRTSCTGDLYCRRLVECVGSRVCGATVCGVVALGGLVMQGISRAGD